MKKTLVTVLLLTTGVLAPGDDGSRNSGCKDLPSANQLKQWMRASAGPAIGGLFNGERMWASVVNRNGELCAFTTSTDDPTQVWPGSQAIAKSKAYTANAFSLDTLSLSTARLYTFTQPGHSLWSLGQSNLFDPKFLAAPSGGDHGQNQIAGGLIFFGGGLALYSNSKIIGAIGISGDTSCADHELAKRVRNLAGLNPPAALGGMLGDDIVYSPPDPPSVFAHPVCLNTKRNGTAIGDEMPASYPRVAPIVVP